ncbi:MAG TPA: triose-phosphate isomerase [Thermomicrobiales bacterium]|nr:triose-phosphate isomerase [Thermomicrobiales bacterium]
MRVPIIAGNWKMNTTYDEAMDLIEELVDGLEPLEGSDEIDVVLCPPVPWLVPAAEYLEDTGLLLGAQNCYWEDRGAFTGEVSAAMLADRCSYVIVGHSERRAHFGETDADVARKVAALLRHGLRPIVCVGESLAERDAGATDATIARQVAAAFAPVEAGQVAECVVAYEPVWAIGSGRAADGAEANRVAALIRRTLAEQFGADLAARARVQYGGSVTGANIAEFISQPEVDGALVGGASLKTNDFIRICEIAAEYATED